MRGKHGHNGGFRLYLLKDLSDSFQTHAGINVPFFEGSQRPIYISVVLHEHKVVQFDEAFIVFKIDGLCTFRMKIVIDLCAWTARTSGT